MLIVRVPLRISLGGGGTDLYNWYSKHGSFLITATINKFIYITLSQRNLEKDFWDSLYKIHVNKRVPTIFIPSHGLSRYNVNRSNEAMASILLYNTGIRYFGLLSVITTVTYIIPKIQGYML